mmetsp:Transcript_5618/g.7781  ORF Transcript_5618/g.7781 Transcript_5618/m.7781 type:complete len:118 (+) Transcript_5618:492-845(+)
MTGFFESPLCEEVSTFFVMEYKYHTALSIYTFCPRLNRTFDGTFIARLRQGDPIVSFGFGIDVKGWTSIIEGHFVKGNYLEIHFSSEAIFKDKEFLALGDQFIRQSGGLVINNRVSK